MTQWEYRIFKTALHQVCSKKDAEERTVGWLNGLGNDCWEAVSLNEDWSDRGSVYITATVKRPIERGPYR